MKTKLKSLIIMTAVAVMLISIGNMPTSTAQEQPALGSLTITEFCVVTIPNQNMNFQSATGLGSTIVNGNFELVQGGSGDSVMTITGDSWNDAIGPFDEVIAVGSTTYDFDNVGAAAFDGNAQALGTISSGDAAKDTALQTTVDLVAGKENFLGALTLSIVLIETACNP